MIPLNRLFLGVSLILVLLSTLSYTLTGTLDAWLPSVGGNAGARIQTAAEPGIEIAGGGPQDLPAEAAASTHAHRSGGGEGQASGAGHPTATGEPQGSDGGDTAATDGKGPATETRKTPKPSQPGKPTTTDPEMPAVEGTISGDSCPCTVTGTAELKGHVNLKGDLMVVGGTLLARPGVTVEGNGFQIMFMEGGRADFRGSKVSTWSSNGAKQNLTRDIVFTDMRRIMFHGGAGPSILKYFSVIDSGTSALGDYPVHFHLNGNSTRGTIVEGVVVLNGRHHAFVPHGSHGITFKDTIAKNTRGEAYWWDDPGTNESCSFIKFCTVDNSNDILYDHALAYGVSNGPFDSRGYRLSGFKLGAGSGNAVVDSAAINIAPTHVKDCAGFSWPEAANQNVGGNVWRFTNNYSTSSSGCHGIFVWQNDNSDHVIAGFSGAAVDHGAYKNRYAYRDIDVSAVEIHAVGWLIENSKLGSVIARAHTTSGTVTFRNVSIDSFTIDDSKGKPADYVVDRTNLECSDVIYKSVAAGSSVIIDGVACDIGG